MDLILKDSLSRFRWVALLEGISFMVLLCIAMPLKYYFGFPMAVKAVGWAHGVLFIMYIYALIQVTIDRRWSIIKAVIAFIVSLIPMGTFWFDIRLKREQQEAIRG